MTVQLAPPLTAFSWGYWGWGNATTKLVEGVDAAEARRGFAPPLFVDVRFRRSVRAVGFNGNTFGAWLTSKRYRWMRALGNKQIGQRKGPRMVIADPRAAFKLLELIRTAAHEGRRVLFFCACEHACDDDGNQCHRTEVARLLRIAAAERDIALRVVEWPGGEPEYLAVPTTPQLLRAIAHGRRTLPIQEPFDLGRMAGLPWGTVAVPLHGEQSVAFVSGPARFSGGGWCLPVLRLFTNKPAERDKAERWGAEFRARRMLEPLPDGPERDRGDLSATCVYTIAHADKLRAIAAASGRGTLTERRAWVSAREHLENARMAGQRLPIVWADATDCSRLLYWGTLVRVDVSTEGTRYTFERLTTLRRSRTPQELTLLSTRQRIAAGFIRPYALCVTPTWLRA